MNQQHVILIFQTAALSSYVKIVEVGPRDGLQNEKVSTVLLVLLILWFVLKCSGVFVDI